MHLEKVVQYFTFKCYRALTFYCNSSEISFLNCSDTSNQHNKMLQTEHVLAPLTVHFTFQSVTK